MNTTIIVTSIVCLTVVLLAAIGTRQNRRPTVSLVNNKDGVKCSGCGRTEAPTAWNSCNYCPTCGALIKRG